MDPYYYKRHHRRRRHRPIIRLIASSSLPSSSSLQLLLFILISSICNYNIPTTNGFAAWFVDRKVSCYTNLAVNEIIMNNAVIPYIDSSEPNIYLNVSPINNEDANANNKNAGPNSEYVVKFMVPEKKKNDKSSLADLQYVLELVNGDGKDDKKDDGGDNVAATFTSAPPGGGGIGCEGKRSHGKVNGQYVSAAIFTINSNANDGDTIEIVGGWATGHEAVTLTDKVVLVVGQGIIVGGGGGGAITDDFHDDDNAPLDDEEWDELEEAFIEEEREEIENEIEEAEEDAVEALEEKRQETDGLGSEINTAEEEIVEEFERNRKDVNEALDALEDEIIAKKESMERGIKPDHKHTRSERREAERKHREQHDRKHTDEDKLQEMYRTLNKKKQNAKQREYDSLKAQKDKIEELMDMESALKNSVDKLHTMDKKEHDKARREHIKPLPKAELNVDMSELKQKAKQRMQMLSDKLGYASDKLGVNELLNDPKVQEIRGKLRKGVPRGGKDGYSRDVGQPLPPEGRHFLFVFFSLFGLVGLIRWAFDKRRRSSRNKGKRTL